MVVSVWGVLEYTTGCSFIVSLHNRCLPGKDLWYKTYHARKDIRSSYCFAPDVPLELPSPENYFKLLKMTRPDPLNSKPELSMEIEEGEKFLYVQSLLEGPEAPSERIFLPREGVPAGTLEVKNFTSQALGNERDIYVYTPPGYDPQGEPYPLLLGFDGKAYTELVPTHTILDNLIAAGKIPPMRGPLA